MLNKIRHFLGLSPRFSVGEVIALRGTSHPLFVVVRIEKQEYLIGSYQAFSTSLVNPRPVASLWMPFDLCETLYAVTVRDNTLLMRKLR